MGRCTGQVNHGLTTGPSLAKRQPQAAVFPHMPLASVLSPVTSWGRMPEQEVRNEGQRAELLLYLIQG